MSKDDRSDHSGAAPAAAPASVQSFVLDGIDFISRWIVIAMLAIMAATISVQVFFRYALNDSIDWADEVSRLTFVWVVFLALPHGLKVGAHVGIDLVVRLVSTSVQQWLFRFTSAIGAALMVVVAAQGIFTSYQTWDQPLSTINAPAALFYVAVIIGASHAALHLLRFTFGHMPSQGAGSEFHLDVDDGPEDGADQGGGEKP